MQELLAQVNREYEQFGRVLPETRRALDSATTGVKNFDMQLDLAANAARGVVGAVTGYTKAMYNGERGMRAFNSSIDSMAGAVQSASASLGQVLPGAIGIAVSSLGFLAGELMKASKVIGEQADLSYDAYKQLAQSGAAAGDGMTGVFEGLQKMGLGVKEAASYVQLFNSNADTMAQFGSTVANGRKIFENTVAEMVPFREQLRAMGIEQEAQNEAVMTYVKIQNRLNIQTRDNTAITGAAAMAYIKEMDLLTKLTGMSAKQQEEIVNEAMRHQVFGSVVDQMISNNQEDAAKLLQAGLKMATAIGNDLGEAWKGVASGMITDEAARKGMMSTNAEIAFVIERIKTGQIKNMEELARAFQGLAGTMAQNKEIMSGAFQTKAAEEFFLSFSSHSNAVKFAANNYSEALQQAMDQQDRQTGANGRQMDEATANYARALAAQQEAMLVEQKTVQLAVGGYVEAAAATAEAHAELAHKAYDAARELANLGLGADATKEKIKAQSDLNWESLTGTSLIVSGIARTVERILRVTSAVIGTFSSKIEEVLDDLADTAERERVKSENIELMGQGRFVEAKPESYSAVKDAGGMRAAADATAMTTSGLKQYGLKLRTDARGNHGDIQVEGAPVSAKLLDLARSIQGNIKGFAHFTGFNDAYHQKHKPKSKHTAGFALDFELAEGQKPSIEEGKKIVEELKRLGAAYAKDEYNFPSDGAVGKGHFHVEVALAKGGLVQQPTVALVGEKGPEAVVPLDRMFDDIKDLMEVSRPRVEMASDFPDMMAEIMTVANQNAPVFDTEGITESLKQTVTDLTRSNSRSINAGFEALISEIRGLTSVNKNLVDIQEKILRMQT